MPVTFAGYECVDPRALLLHCDDRKIPFSPWVDRANLFTCPAGRGPGRGAVLMTYQDLKAIDRAADHSLKFRDDATEVSLKRLTITRATCVVPGTPDKLPTPAATQATPGEPWRVYLVELADRRLHLDRVPISEGFNLRDTAGTGWLAESVNAGTPWTWDEVGQALWDAVGGGAVLGVSWPGLGWTPDGTPENLDYYGEPGRHWSAWGALNDFLERLAAVPDYDPVADTFTVRRIGAEPATETEALTRLGKEPLTWDGDPVDPVRATRPEKVRVRFWRTPGPTDGADPWYSVDVTLAAADGVVAGSTVQLEDDATAAGATGSPSNAAALATRAAERAADWLRKFEKRDRRILRVYRDLSTDPGVVVGATATAASWEDRANGLRAELSSGPDYALERWRRVAARAAGGAAGSFLVLLTQKIYADPDHPEYRGFRVTADDSTPITYTVGAAITDLYHERDLDLPVVGETTPGTPDLIDPWSVVRVRANGDHYLFETEPHADLFRRTGDSDADGEIVYERVWNGSAWADGRQCRLIVSE